MDFSLLESVPDGIVVVDESGSVVYLNGVAERLFGWSREELTGRPVEVLLPGRFQARHVGVREAYADNPRPRPMGIGSDLAGLRKDGSEFPAEISLSPLQAEGRSWAMAAVRDSTERRRIEAKALLYRQAQEEVRARDEFLSVASQELRTPVTALHVQVQMLGRVVERAASPPLVRDRVVALEGQVRRLAGLVEALLDLSRIRLGRMELARESTDLSALVREVAAPYQADVDLARGSAIRVIARDPVVASIDRVRIEQVIGNLVGNAVKFGEGKPIEIRVERTANGVRVEVSDCGVGIDPVHAERIFGRFERAAPAQHYPGLGLGLYVAREIVEAHGGRIHARGEPGKGAVLSVELPP